MYYKDYKRGTVEGRVDPEAPHPIIDRIQIEDMGLKSKVQPYDKRFTLKTGHGSVEVVGVIRLEWNEVDGEGNSINGGSTNFFVAKKPIYPLHVPSTFGQTSTSDGRGNDYSQG